MPATKPLVEETVGTSVGRAKVPVTPRPSGHRLVKRVSITYLPISEPPASLSSAFEDLFAMGDTWVRENGVNEADLDEYMGRRPGASFRKDNSEIHSQVRRRGAKKDRSEIEVVTPWEMIDVLEKKRARASS